MCRSKLHRVWTTLVKPRNPRHDNGMSIRLIALIAMALVVLVAAVQILNPGPLRQGREGLFDIYQRLAPRAVAPEAENRVVIVDIDDESLSKNGQWPWPRNIVARMLDRLTEAGVTAVGFDMVFSEPDRTSPRRVLEDVSDLADHERDALIQRFPDFDQQLALALKRGRAVLGAAGVAENRLPRIEPRGGVIAMGKADISDFVPRFNGLLAPLPVLANAAGSIAALNRVVAPDGVLREVPLVVRAGDWLLPSLGLATLAMSLGADSPVAEVTSAGLVAVMVGDHRIQTTAQGSVRLHFNSDHTRRTVPAWQVLENKVGRDKLAGRMVLVGSSALGLNDIVPTPLGIHQPGVEAHALVIDHILAGDALLRPAWAAVAEGLVTLVLGVALSLFSHRAGALRGAILALAALVVLAGVSWLAYTQSNLLFDPLPGSAALLGAFLICSMGGYLASEQQARWIRSAFASYVSPNLVAHLVENPGALMLGGERRECSFVMSDLTDFTPLLERYPPEQVVAVLNQYLDGMVSIAFAHGGTLDRIVGDAVAVLFSAPVVQPDHRSRAVRCALAMDRFARDFAAQRREEGLPFGETRIGVHSGEVIIGNFGGKRVLDYRALGDAINTASRLEGAGKYLGVQVCISAEALVGVDAHDVKVRPIGHVRLKGKETEILVFEAVIDGDDRFCNIDDYIEAIGYLKSGDSSIAMAKFSAIHKKFPKDNLVSIYVDRLNQRLNDMKFHLFDK